MNDKTNIEDHPISLEKAKELLSGDLGDVYRDILQKCCIPIYWFINDVSTPEIKFNGTLTIVETPNLILGITAAHVIRAYQEDCKSNNITLMFQSVVIEDLSSIQIDINDEYDLATISIDNNLFGMLGDSITPIANWPPKPPEEGRGIILAGYPGTERLIVGELEVNFGLFTALVVARTVTETQITWLIEPEHQLENSKIEAPPPEYNLGGISGGPLIAFFESENYITHYCLSGIITEHPNYEENEFVIERVVSIRADRITENGYIAC